MAVLLALLCALVLAACGGGSGGASQSNPSELLVAGFPGTVPRFVYDVPSGTFDNPPPDFRGWSLTARHMGARPYDSNSFDARDSLYRSRIDSASFTTAPIRGAGPHSALMYSFEGEPVFKDARALVFSFNAGLGEQLQSGGNIAQASLVGYVTDGAGNVFAFVFNFFDNRHATYSYCVE